MAFFNEYPYTDFHELNLDWLIKNVKTLLNTVKSIDGWIEEHQKEYEELKQLYDDILNGNFPDSIKEAFYNWCQENLIDLVGEIIHNVYFGLSNSGYFVAYIPKSWEGVEFDTIQEGELYGHLILQYD